MDLDLKSARELVANGVLWPKVRDYLAAGKPLLDFSRPESRFELLDEETRRQVALWLEALPQAASWKIVVDGARVRQLRAEFPGVYPEIFRYLPYFKKFDLSNAAGSPEVVQCLLKLKFPEAYALCYS